MLRKKNFKVRKSVYDIFSIKRYNSGPITKKFKVRGATFSLKKNNRAEQMKKAIIMSVRNDPKDINITSLSRAGWI